MPQIRIISSYKPTPDVEARLDKLARLLLSKNVKKQVCPILHFTKGEEVKANRRQI